MDSEDKSSYKQIMKATSLFGGVQVFNIIIQIIRSKIIAMLLGPAGMGIAGLLTATTSLVSNLTNFGLGTSAVRNISTANATGDNHKIAKTVTILRKWVWATGILGMLGTLILSPYLSKLTFGDKTYTLAFVWLSVTLLFTQLTSGQLVILQGLRKLKHLAKANLLGTSIGLFVTVPLYYFFRLDGIVPALIVSGILSLFFAWFFADKIELQKIKLTRREIVMEGKDMLRMGFMLSLSSLITLGVGYLIRIYINNTGGVNEVGLYNAGFAIINTYVGLVFTAMGADYYPRLAAVCNDNLQAKKLINQQGEIAIIVLSPILCVFLVFIHYAIILLYSRSFLEINGMIQWAAIGMFFKAICWSVGFIFLAKGNARLFFWNELLANIYLLTLGFIGYKYWGLDGLGISFLLTYLVYLVQVYLVSRNKYVFNFNSSLIRIFIFQFSIGLLCFLTVKFLESFSAYIIGMALILISIWFSFKELDKRLGMKNLLYKYGRKE